MSKNIKSVLQTIFSIAIFSWILFILKDVDFNTYLGIAFALFILLNICFYFWKNKYLYLTFILSAIQNLWIYLFKKYDQGYRICWDKTDIAYLVYVDALVLCLILVVIISFVNRKEKKVTVIRNYFSERKYDLKRLIEYIEKYPVTGIDSLWGDGKTYLCRLLQQKIKNYFYISISVMSVQTDTVERILIDEINGILKQNRIFSAVSNKFNNFLKSGSFYGLGNLFSKNDSYTEMYNVLIKDIEKLKKPILVTFEDIDRIQEKVILYKIFAITELLTTKSQKIKVLFQYNEKILLEKLAEKKFYLEKYIPYTINLTPITFRKAVKVLLQEGKEENRFSNIDEKDLDFITQEIHMDYNLQRLLCVNKTFTLQFNFAIRSIELFLNELNELNELLKNDEYKKNKNVVIVFLVIKHYFSDIYNELSFDDRFIEICNFEIEDKKYSIFELITYFTQNKEDRNELFNKLFQNNSTNINHLILLHLFEYNFTQIKRPESGEENILSILNEDSNNIKVIEHNDKIDRLIWNLMANGKSELTNLENAVKELEKVLDKSGDEREKLYEEFLKSSYNEDFEKTGNTTVFRLGISNYLPIFQGFRIYEKKSDYWVKLIDFYFEKQEKQVIIANTIHILNNCDISNRKS